jgi:O-antigen ligase
MFLGGYEYPHNILIEFFFEMGLIGLFFAVLYIYFNLSVYTNKSRDKIVFSLLIIHGILFYSGMFSSTLHSSSMSQLLIFSFMIYRYIEITNKGKI